MIIGIGHDLADIGRVATMLDGRHGVKFLERVLTEEEAKTAGGLAGSRMHQFVAGRFAAKEAVSKAFGCGIGGVIGFRDIQIKRDDNGRPFCGLADDAWTRLGINPEFIEIHITITHERGLASAFAVVERIKR